MTVGERIKQIRKTKKITQKEMSDRVCVTQSYISRVETDKEIPTDMLMKLISLEFNVSYDWLKWGKGEIDISNETYFDLQSASELRRYNIKNINKFLDFLEKNSSPAIDICITGIISGIVSMFEQFGENDNICAIILEKLSYITLSFTDTILEIEKLDIKNPAYLNQIFSYLRNAGVDIGNDLDEVGRFYEKRLM